MIRPNNSECLPKILIAQVPLGGFAEQHRQIDPAAALFNLRSLAERSAGTHYDKLGFPLQHVQPVLLERRC